MTNQPNEITKSIIIHGPPDRVFDLVTTAKYWPEWHPATLGVSGAVDKPMQLGDRIRERARIGGAVGESDWVVAEHERPKRVVLKMPGTRLGDLEISYRFESRDDGVEFTRQLKYDESNLPAGFGEAIRKQMDEDSTLGLSRLKSIVERLA